jgi:hypothetical protein
VDDVAVPGPDGIAGPPGRSGQNPSGVNEAQQTYEQICDGVVLTVVGMVRKGR